MKAIMVHTKKGNISNDSLLYEGIEMAKMEVATNLWYNMNIKRIQRLVSFCMDYLRCQKQGYIEMDEEKVEFPCTAYTYYN